VGSIVNPAQTFKLACSTRLRHRKVGFSHACPPLIFNLSIAEMSQTFPELRKPAARVNAVCCGNFYVIQTGFYCVYWQGNFLNVDARHDIY
jgi:hypothetical protein